MSNVDLLIRSSDYLEATELRHAEFKRQIKREMLSSTLNEDSEMPSSSEIDEVEDDGSAPSGSGETNLEGKNDCVDDDYLYTLVQNNDK